MYEQQVGDSLECNVGFRLNTTTRLYFKSSIICFSFFCSSNCNCLFSQFIYLLFFYIVCEWDMPAYFQLMCLFLFLPSTLSYLYFSNLTAHKWQQLQTVSNSKLHLKVHMQYCVCSCAYMSSIVQGCGELLVLVEELYIRVNMCVLQSGRRTRFRQRRRGGRQCTQRHRENRLFFVIFLYYTRV